MLIYVRAKIQDVSESSLYYFMGSFTYETLKRVDTYAMYLVFAFFVEVEFLKREQKASLSLSITSYGYCLKIISSGWSFAPASLGYGDGIEFSEELKELLPDEALGNNPMRPRGIGKNIQIEYLVYMWSDEETRNEQRAFNINEPIYAELCHEFYSTYEFDEVCADDELGLYQAVELEREGFNVYFEGGLRSDDNFNAQDYWYDKIQKNDLWLLSMFDARHQNGVLTEDVVRSLSALIYCRDLDTITLRDLIDSDGKLIPEDPQTGVPRVGILRPLRAFMQDLYDRIGRMEIRQEVIDRMEYMQSYH
ncbi:hypothetical protein Tco_1405835 [Tanacetum coccineum]